MTLIQAATRTATYSPVTRVFVSRSHGKAANDNGQYDDADREILNAALRYFAQHGLGAAEEARAQAETCFAAGDQAGFDHWLAICRKLDRRLAQKMSQQCGQLGGQLECGPAA